MAEMLINNWGGGIGSDEDLNLEGEVFDALNIDFSSPRKIRALGGFAFNSVVRTGGALDYQLYKATENPYTKVFSFGDDGKVLEGTTLRSIGYHAFVHETIGTTNDTYNETTSPLGMRHFFFGDEDRIIYTNYNGTTIGTIDISASNIKGKPTCSAYLWRGALIYAQGGNIYEVNPSTTTPIFNGLKIALQLGADIKYMYYNNGLIWIVYTLGASNDTYIQGCQYNGTTYVLNNYSDKISGQRVLGAIGDSGIIYWISETSINMWSGQNQIVKRFYERNGTLDYFFNKDFTSSQCLSYNNGYLRILSGSGDIYIYGSNKPGYKKTLSRMAVPSGYELSCFTDSGNYIMYKTSSTEFYYTTLSSNFNLTNYIVTHPYTAGVFGKRKKGLRLRSGFILPKNRSCSIKISMLTDRIFWDLSRDEYADYVELATITDSTIQYYDINTSVISKKLGDAGYSEEFGWVKFKIDLISGTPSGSLYSYAPTFYDYYLNHDNIKE